MPVASNKRFIIYPLEGTPGTSVLPGNAFSADSSPAKGTGLLNAAGGAGGMLGLCGVVGAGYDSQWDSIKLNEGVHAVIVSSKRSE